MKQNFPTDDQQYEMLMLEIDLKLAKKGFSIPQRPIHAIGEVADCFSLPLPISDPLPNTYHESYQFWPISSKIYDWYKSKYGDRLKMDLSIGRMAFLIDRDIWVFRLPLIYGRARFISYKTAKPENFVTGNKPLYVNIIDCILDLPDGIRMSFTQTQLREMLILFDLGYKAFNGLDSFRKNELIMSGLSDLDISVSKLYDKNPNYGLSKWSSLQASEKFIKAAITIANGEFSKTHNLKKLQKELDLTQLDISIRKYINSLECSPGIRYGDELCSLDEALLAHHCALKVANEITKGIKNLNG